MPHLLRRWLIITKYTVYPNRKLNIFEKIWYVYLRFSRFDSAENLAAALDLPKVNS